MSPQRKAARPEPTSVADVLEGTRHATLKRSGAALDRHSWRRAVGRRIAERTEVGALRAGELCVFVASAAWAQELSFLTKEILERLARQGLKAERIRFRVKEGLGAPRVARPARPEPPPVALPQELAAHLATVKDDELRGAITRAAGLALSRLAARAEQERRPARAATSTKPGARAPRAAAARSAPKAQRSAESSEARSRKRG